MAFGGSMNRYFAPCHYNMVRAVNRLAELVEAEGGTVDRHSVPLHIRTRGYMEELNRTSDAVKRMEAALRQEADCRPEELHQRRVNMLAKLKEHLAYLEQKQNEAPIIRTEFVSLVSDLWLRFKLDGYAYYFEVDDNPFFPDKYCKTPADGDGRYYFEEIDCEEKVYYPDDFFKPVAAEEMVDVVARSLLDFLKDKRVCVRYA